MSKYEKELKKALNCNKIIFYDYIQYKKASGWKINLTEKSLKEPTIIQKAKYNGKFLNKLPNYYYLGIPIKELLKTEYSNGCCHACILALSTYFKEFEIITCNLKLYAKHYDEVTKSRNNTFKHSFLLLNINNKKIVIDTTFGLITDLQTYNKIFEPNNIKIITSEDLNKTNIYNYIKHFKKYKLNSIDNECSIIKEFFKLCNNYSNKYNPTLEDFINRCIPITTKIEEWKECKNYSYPTDVLYSLYDNNFDISLNNKCLSKKI